MASKKLKSDALSKITFGKKGIYIRLDVAILDFFKKSGDRWQSRINEVLRRYMEDNSK